jgi:signal transduction histidine kinase/ActR/RegA family two-component response regulator
MKQESTARPQPVQMEMLTEAINQSREHIFAARADGSLVFGNRRFRQHFAIEEEAEITGLKIYETSSFFDEMLWEELTGAIRAKGEFQNMIIQHPFPLFPDVEAIEGDLYRCLDARGEELFWGFGRDITALTRHQRELEKMNEALKKAKEKAENSDHNKSAFLANMSHEIRTPLNAIVGFSRIISESDDAGDRKNYYNMVASNSERLLQLINEILDLSKMESGHLQFTIAPVLLHQLCKEVYDAHVFRCPEEVQLIFEPSDEHIRISTDKNRIIQVLSNLIGNAFKFTTQGSIRYGYERKGTMIVFHVTDTGSGIAPDKIETVFERFIKGNTSVQGTGLGLSICKTIVERLGGTITVTSDPGKSTTFTFTLPNKLEEDGGDLFDTPPLPPEPKQSTEPSPAELPSVEKKTVLVAEDTDFNYILVNAILGKIYTLVHAKDGMEAVRLFEETNPDLILMDMKMPNMGGLDATRIIRQLSSEVPIIAFTAFAFDHDKQAALEAGCNDFLTKPFTQEALKEMIVTWLNKANSSE